jgi:hypothetical protein
MSPEREAIRQELYAAREHARRREYAKPLRQTIRDSLAYRGEQAASPWDRRPPGPVEFDRWGRPIKQGLFR